jgi:D-alanyl-D-alanine carboxypeptidase
MKDMSNGKVLFWRIVLIAACMICAGICLYVVNQSYDPLARYPYATEENREEILEHLNSEDIDYIVTQQILPEQFLPYVDVEGFELRNTLYYWTAQQTRDLDAQSVVYFVNRFKDEFSLNQLQDYLSHYSYQDLTAYFENEQVLHENTLLSTNPDDPLLVLNGEVSVYTYEPSDLVQTGSVQLKEEAAEAFEQMQEAYAKVSGQEMKAETGYLSYESCVEIWNRLTLHAGDKAAQIAGSAGQNEAQLGYTVSVTGAADWNSALVDSLTDEELDYDKLMEGLSDEEQELAHWLQENAWRYGFVVRFGQGQDVLWQPFTLRYVGKENAKLLHETGAVLDSADLEELQ